MKMPYYSDDFLKGLIYGMLGTSGLFFVSVAIGLIIR